MAYNAAEIMSAVGTLAAGGAAVYVAIVGMRQYRDSVRLRSAATLAEIEKEFVKSSARSCISRTTVDLRSWTRR
jgi:hypothetical protein